MRDAGKMASGKAMCTFNYRFMPTARRPPPRRLQGIGSHAIDQCRFLVGEIKSVSALVRAFNADRAVESAGDSSATSDEGTAALLDFENGAIGVLESAVVAPGSRNSLSTGVK